MNIVSTFVHSWCAIVGNYFLVSPKYSEDGGVDPNLTGIRLWSIVSVVAAAVFCFISYFTCPGGDCGVKTF